MHAHAHCAPTAHICITSDITATWTALLFEYRRRLLLRDADVSFGDLGRAIQAQRDAEATVSWSTGGVSPEKRQEVLAALREAEEVHWSAYSQPCDEAARALVLADAPDLDAVALKLELINAFEFHCDPTFPCEPIEIVREDIARLSK